MKLNAFQFPKEFLVKFPDMPKERADKHFKTYLQMMRNEILRQLPFIKDDEIKINLNRLWAYQFKYKNKIFYIWREFSDLLPFAYIHNKGSNIKNHISIGKILNQHYIDLLIDTADTEELVNMYYGSTPSLTDMVCIPINMKSLCGYIDATEHKLNNSYTNENHQNKMLANLRSAKYIKIISKHYYDTYGDYVLPHIKSTSIYGRTYYKGLNLQNISKEVRAAVLGTHYQYDLYAAIFAIKLYFAQQILKAQGKNVYAEYGYTTEYLDNKDMIRKRLGKLIHAYPDGTKLVKEAITAIGFGARLSGGAWLEGLHWQTSSIKDIIKNKDDFKRFANDHWLKGFHREQKELTNLIVEYHMQHKEFVEKINNLPDVLSVNGNYNKQKIMSYIFQHAETMIIDSITENVNPIIRIHDAFLVKNKIPTEQLLDIKTTLNSSCEFFKLEMTEIQGWNSFDAILFEQEHEEFILKEELLANNGIMPIKFMKQNKKVFMQTDNTYYDGYDDGRHYDSYDPERDDMIEQMTYDERIEHYRIVGYYPNKLPEYINKLLETNK
jgi:hypothetical protein